MGSIMGAIYKTNVLENKKLRYRFDHSFDGGIHQAEECLTTDEFREELEQFLIFAFLLNRYQNLLFPGS